MYDSSSCSRNGSVSDALAAVLAVDPFTAAVDELAAGVNGVATAHQALSGVKRQGQQMQMQMQQVPGGQGAEQQARWLGMQLLLRDLELWCTCDARKSSSGISAAQ